MTDTHRYRLIEMAGFDQYCWQYSMETVIWRPSLTSISSYSFFLANAFQDPRKHVLPQCRTGKRNGGQFLHLCKHRGKSDQSRVDYVDENPYIILYLKRILYRTIHVALIVGHSFKVLLANCSKATGRTIRSSLWRTNHFSSYSNQFTF